MRSLLRGADQVAYQALLRSAIASAANVTAGPRAYYGSALDGPTVFDGTILPFANLVGTTYTTTRDIDLTDFTIPPGFTVIAPFRIYVTGTSLINGILQNNGSNAAGTSGGAGALGGIFSPGANGGDGSLGASVGGNGQAFAPTVAITDFGNPFPLGVGGAGGGNAGGSPSTGAIPYVPTQGQMDSIPETLLGATFAIGTWYPKSGGAGGGGGGAGAASTGGGGGGGGGILGLYTRILKGSGTITALGGSGAAGTGASGGGGGGGDGGLLLMILGDQSQWTGTFVVDAGTGGAGSGTGTAGSDGERGGVCALAG